MNDLFTQLKNYFSWGFKCFPSYVYFGKDKKKHFIFGPEGTPYSGWACDHTFETFKKRSDLLIKNEKHPNSICIKTGRDSNLSILDIDSKNPDAIKIIQNKVPNIFNNPHVQSPSGGFHFYFKYNHQTRTITGGENGIDVRSDGGLVIAPPSKNTKGEYKWIKEIDINALSEFPLELIGMIFGFANFKKHQKSTKVYSETIPLSEINGMLALIHDAKRCTYDEWLAICSAVWDSYSFDDTIGMLMKHHPFNNVPQEYMYRKKYDARLKNVSLGTLVHYYQLAKEEFTPLPEFKPVSDKVFVPEKPKPIVVLPEKSERIIWQEYLDFCNSVGYQPGDTIAGCKDGTEVYLGNGKFEFKRG